MGKFKTENMTKVRKLYLPKLPITPTPNREPIPIQDYSKNKKGKIITECPKEELKKLSWTLT